MITAYAIISSAGCTVEELGPAGEIHSRQVGRQMIENPIYAIGGVLLEDCLLETLKAEDIALLGRSLPPEGHARVKAIRAEIKFRESPGYTRKEIPMVDIKHVELRRRIQDMFGSLVTNKVEPGSLNNENPAVVLAALALNIFPGLKDHMDFDQLQAIVTTFDDDSKEKANEPPQDRL